MTYPAHTGRGATRRTVVTAAGAAGLAAALTSCDDDGASDHSSGDQDTGSGQLARTGDIPEGGGKVFKDQKVVVTQPSAGTFKAFSAVCPHQGCLVGDVSGGTINCPCHQSKFDLTDGSPKGGPANKPLDSATVTVEGDAIMLG